MDEIARDGLDNDCDGNLDETCWDLGDVDTFCTGNSGGQLGYRASMGLDYDGDGTGDLALSSHTASTAASTAGAIFLFSGPPPATRSGTFKSRQARSSVAIPFSGLTRPTKRPPALAEAASPARGSLWGRQFGFTRNRLSGKPPSTNFRFANSVNAMKRSGRVSQVPAFR